MFNVRKRNKSTQSIDREKLLTRVSRLVQGLDFIDAKQLVDKVIDGAHEGISSHELDNLLAETCAYMTVQHPDYSKLAGRLKVTSLHKLTSDKFSQVAHTLYNYHLPMTKEHSPLLSKQTYDIIVANADELDKAVCYERDYNYDYFGFKTLERSYLLKVNGTIVERPQHMLMRVAVGIHKEDIKAVIETYDLLSQGWFTHASPTLFSAGTPHPQMSSCFLIDMAGDSIDGIYDTLKTCALISKSAGGIGLNVHKIRASGSYIRGTNGVSNGLVPMLRVFNDTARYVDQCFAGSTILYTKDGPIPMSDLKVGDQVLTHTGSFQKIEKVMVYEKQNEQVFKIVTEHCTGEPVIVTKEHPFLAFNHPEADDKEAVKRSLQKGFVEADWEDVKDLKDHSFLLTPQSKFECDIPEISQQDCFFYGLLLSKCTPVSKSDSEITIGSDKQFQLVASYFDEHNIPYQIHDSNSDSSMRRTVTFSHIELPIYKGFANSSHSNSETYDPSRTLFPAPLLHLPKEKTFSMIAGLIQCHCDGHEDMEEQDYFSFKITSKQLIDVIRFVLSRFGILLSIHRSEENSDRSTYIIRIPRSEELEGQLLKVKSENASASGLYYKENMTASKISKIEEDSFTGKLYDLEVANDHSYTTEIGVVHNGGGKRKGSFAMYLEPWHADIFAFLDLKKNSGKEELRARDLFYALWIPDLFMKRVESNSYWSLFCPNEAPGLHDVWGDKFEALYERYEKEGRAKKTIKARDLWFAILDSQIETGTPYMLYKDACNRKSNQQNLGTIQSSNLCTEIVEYTSKDEVAVCNLASIALPKFVSYDSQTKKPFYDFQKLYDVARVATKNLNKVIDLNYYPVKEARNSNMRHRPIGIGVQGLADAFILMRYPFDSEEAKKLNREIFETIYFAAVTTSKDLAKEFGPYETFKGSPMSEGKFQFDLWEQKPNLSGRWDWEALRSEVMKFGIRNSLLVAPMPTASTSQILGNNECFEPYTTNIYTRRVLSGEFPVINHHLVRDLIKLNLWNPSMINKIIAHRGSVQYIDEIPQEYKDLYKTAWELKQRVIIDMAADRGPFICQSQSMNVFFAEPNAQKLTSMHFHAWKRGLKTGMYYLRTRPAADAIQFTVDMTGIVKQEKDTSAKEELTVAEGTDSTSYVGTTAGLTSSDALSIQEHMPFGNRTKTAKKKLKFSTAIKKGAGLIPQDEEECLVCGS